MYSAFSSSTMNRWRRPANGSAKSIWRAISRVMVAPSRGFVRERFNVFDFLFHRVITLFVPFQPLLVSAKY